MITTGYEQLDDEIVQWAIRMGYTDRIVCLDLETKVVDGNFLTGETLLSAALSRRTNDIETETYILEEESASGELQLMTELDELLLKLRPVIVIGFNHRGYDNVLLAMKKRLQAGPGLWGIKDMLERAYMLDILHASRFAIAHHDGTRPKILPLSKVIEHPMFAHLPLKRTKNLISEGMEKGAQIYDMWKTNKQKFRAYAEGDSHDTLLIFEQIFKTSAPASSSKDGK